MTHYTRTLPIIHKLYLFFTDDLLRKQETLRVMLPSLMHWNSRCPCHHKVLLSPFVRNYFRSNASGTQKSMPKINQATVAKTLIPLPPKQEVTIILSKLKSIFAYCDELEQQINKSQQNSKHLMPTVLKEAFESK
jgi:hypothetical protein